MTSIARIGLISLCLTWSQFNPVQASEDANGCNHHIAQWLDPGSGEILSNEQVFKQLASTRIVLLGESHTTLAHHRWQQYMLAALHSRKANMVIGFEMLPRRVQSALDDWSAGKLTDKEFLEQSEWKKVWSYDAEPYLPLLHFARLHRLPTVALNVDRELVSLVGQKGWQALSDDQRMGLADPAAASDAYRNSLAELYAYKQSLATETEGGEVEAKQPDLEAIKSSDGFANFVDAQLLWDRAMAEALAAAHRRDPSAIVVGIVGRGHLEYGYGIPHQLADMGIEDVDVLLPLNSDENCDPLPAELASAVFVVDAPGDASPRPRLGVVIENSDNGVRVMQVIAASVAAKSGILEGDLIQSAAGFETRTNTALIEIIQRQAPGTWLPLGVLRGEAVLHLLAKFPQTFE